MNDKEELKKEIIIFNKSHKLKLSFGSPYGSNKYLFIHKNKEDHYIRFKSTSKLKFKDRILFKNYSGALIALNLLKSYLKNK